MTSSNLTTVDLEAAIRAIDAVSREIAKDFTRHPPGWVRRLRRRFWQRAQDLRQHYGPERGPAAAVAATRALTATLEELVDLQLLHTVTAELYQEQLRAAAQQQQPESTPKHLTGPAAPATDTVERGGHLIQVTRQVHQLVLYHIGSTGINRPWRIARRIQRTYEYTTGYIDNAVSQLSRERESCPALLAPVEYQGERARYPYKSRSRRTLYWLTPTGQSWYAQAYGAPAKPSELPARIKAHHGLVHAVDILEARDLFTDLGFEVEEEPEPLLFTDDVWGPRSEPDLLLTDADGAWPVEVQRDIRRAHERKWAKALELTAGRLIIVLETAQDQARQARLLRNARHRLPPGQVRLIDLWTLRSLVNSEQAGAVSWVEIATGVP
jgi:hypothetical protein